MRAASGPDFPSLTTSRLRLRAPAPDDAEAFGAILSVPEVTRFSNWPDRPKKTQIARFVRWMVELHRRGSGCAWMIEDIASGSVAGAIRFNRFDRTWRYGVVGYESHPDFWGRGLMTEALRAVRITTSIATA